MHDDVLNSTACMIKVVAEDGRVREIPSDWDGQRKRIERKEALNSTAVMMTVVAEDGKKREMTCLPIEVLNG